MIKSRDTTQTYAIKTPAPKNLSFWAIIKPSKFYMVSKK